MPILVKRLRGLRWRLGLLHAVDCTVSFLFAATWAACGWLVLARLFPLLGDALPVFAALWVAAAIGAAVQAYRHWPDLIQAALAADRRLGLKERFTSSLALHGTEGPMVEAVHRDAERHLGSLNVRRDFPLETSRSMKWFAIPLLIFGAGYIFLPEFDLFHFQERQAEAKQEQARIEDRANRLRATAKALQPPEEIPLAEWDARAAELETIAGQLEQGEITEKQALARMTDMAKAFSEQQRALAQKKAEMPKLGDLARDLAMAKGLAGDLNDNRMAAAAQKMKKLEEQLKSGELDEAKRKTLAKELKQLSDAMAANSEGAGAELAEALAELSENLNASDLDMEKALDQMKAAEMSLEDMESALQQLAMMESMLGELGEWQKGLLGPAKFCRMCGKLLKHGDCEGGDCEACNCCGLCPGCAGSIGVGSGSGLGLMGAGHGQGNRVGELPDIEAGFDPTKLTGAIGEGKILASITQRGAPEIGAKSTVQVLEGALVSARQEAEQALTQEEIPRGSKEYVRQYFGAIETKEAGQ